MFYQRLINDSGVVHEKSPIFDHVMADSCNSKSFNTFHQGRQTWKQYLCIS